MARSFHTELLVEVPAHAVTDALTAFAKWKEWMPGLVAVVPETSGPFGIDTVWVETRRMFGREASETFRVTAYEPGRHLALYVDGALGSSKRGEYTFQYDLEPAEQGTRVVFSGTIDMPGFGFRLLGGLLLGSLRKACERDLAALKWYLEHGEHTAHAAHR